MVIYQSSELERQREETRRNERRFLAYNRRRHAAGLEPLSYADFMLRMHRTPAPVRPVNRDNISLWVRE